MQLFAEWISEMKT